MASGRLTEVKIEQKRRHTQGPEILEVSRIAKISTRSQPELYEAQDPHGGKIKVRNDSQKSEYSSRSKVRPDSLASEYSSGSKVRHDSQMSEYGSGSKVRPDSLKSEYGAGSKVKRDFVYLNSAYVGSVEDVDQNRLRAPPTSVIREQYWTCSKWPFGQRLLAIAVGLLLGTVIGLVVIVVIRGTDKEILPFLVRQSAPD